jgi:glyoxylase-like metal-dependent hydrolase (beta-lactamase superfamily II)
VVELVAPALYRIEVPLPGNPLKSINSYLIKGNRNLIVDTGMQRPECQDALQAGLNELEVDLGRTDFFITHLHADHLGLVTAFASKSSRVYFNEPEAEFIAGSRAKGGFMAFLAAQALRSGISAAQLEEAMRQHPGFKYSPPDYPEFTILHDGDSIRAGDYELTCIHTPGHTPGHLCLYAANEKILLSGDHVLGDITPNISAWADDTDMLGVFLSSLDKVNGLDVRLVLPGHRRVFNDLGARIEEIKQHHRARLDNVLSIVRGRPGTAYEVASRMKWEFVADSWEQFPMMQKWFATGEAAAHLIYLAGTGEVKKTEQGGVLVYSVA